jgi:hypothetical protein
MRREFKQVASIPSTGENRPVILALASDGTLWITRFDGEWINGWMQLEDLPEEKLPTPRWKEER